MRVFAIINIVGTKINVDMNVQNRLTKVDYDKGFIQNPSNYKSECDKPCDIREYLYYKNCKCRKKINGG